MRIFMLIGLMTIASSVVRAEVLSDNGIGDGDNGSNNHTYHQNGVKISFKRSVRTLNVTFNTPCDDAEVVIYKDGVPVDDDNIGSVDAGTTETYSVEGCERDKVSVSVIRDGKELWIDNLNETE